MYLFVKCWDHAWVRTIWLCKVFLNLNIAVHRSTLTSKSHLFLQETKLCCLNKSMQRCTMRTVTVNFVVLLSFYQVRTFRQFYNRSLFHFCFLTDNIFYFELKSGFFAPSIKNLRCIFQWTLHKKVVLSRFALFYSFDLGIR